MQLIAEAYDLLAHGRRAAARADRGDLPEWNKGELESYLIEITAEVLGQVDDATGRPLVDVIVDQAEQKGTGRWTVQTRSTSGCRSAAIAEAVFARSLSGHARAARAARARWPGPRTGTAPTSTRFVEDVRRALYASKVVAYAQGFDQMRAASRGVRLGHRPRRDGDDLARRVHHPGPVPGPDPPGVRRRPGAADAAARRRGSPTPSATRRTPGGAWSPMRRQQRHPGARLLLGAGLVRRPAARPAAGRADPGPAGLLRRAHLPAGGRRRLVPHPLGTGRRGGAHRPMSELASESSTESSTGIAMGQYPMRFAVVSARFLPVHGPDWTVGGPVCPTEEVTSASQSMRYR